MKPWLLYAIVRVGLLAVAVAAMWLVFGADWATWWWLAIILAAIIAWTVSYLAFGRLRDQVAMDLANRQRRVGDRDAADEDAEAETVGSETVRSETVRSEPVEGARDERA